jgi:hypothetical protein
MMSRHKVGFPAMVWIAACAGALAIAACGGSAGVSPTPGAAAAPGSAAADSATQAAPAQAVSAGNAQTGSGGYGLVPLPTGTADWLKDKVFKVGDAIRDPASGLIYQVTSVRTNRTLGGLDTGQTWLLADITIGNAGTETVSISTVGNFYYRDASGNDPGYGLHLLGALASKILTSDNQLDVDIEPGTAFHGLLPMSGPAGASGLVLYFTPVQITSNSPFMVSVGP